jgi:hypothetical protein
MAHASRNLSGLAIGAVFPALVVGIASLAPLLNDQFMTPIDGRILSVAGWFLLPLGVVAAILCSRRMWPGWVMGVVSAAAFHFALVLLLPEADRASAAVSIQAWIGALAVVVLPWAIGMLFGWTSLHRQPTRHDGVSRDRTASGGAVR